MLSQGLSPRLFFRYKALVITKSPSLYIYISRVSSDNRSMLTKAKLSRRHEPLLSKREQKDCGCSEMEEAPRKLSKNHCQYQASGYPAY